MTQEPTLGDVLEAVNDGFQQMEVRFTDLQNEVRTFKVETGEKFDQVDGRFDQLEKRFDAKLVRVEMQLDAKLDRVEKHLDAKINERFGEVMTHVDGFIHLHQKLDHEIVAECSARERLENRVGALEAKP